MNYVLDTNVLLFYLKDSETKQFIEENFGPFQAGNTAIISIVTVGEIGVLARRNRWGSKRLKIVEKLYDRLVIVDINAQDIIEAYIDVDSYSEGKHPTKIYKNSSRNMGKNDVWIAATTIVTNAELITSDRDFEHLDGEFFTVNLVS